MRRSSDLVLRFSLPRSDAPGVSLKGQLALNDVALAEPGCALARRAGGTAAAASGADAQSSPLAWTVELARLQVGGQGAAGLGRRPGDADGRLEAKNQVTLNQLTFGERIESPSATQLPVLLAVALLSDRNGVIDINLPVSGSVNDPKFSVGGIVWQVIVNLLTKAVTAPFSLLAGGNDLSQVEFQPGTAGLAAGSRWTRWPRRWPNGRRGS